MSGSDLSKSVTIKDVARTAGVALGTVSRILNGHDNVDPALRLRVLEVIEALGYRRNAAARSMRSGRTHVVGCIVSDFRQPVAAAMVSAAETTLRSAGYAMIVASTHYDDDREAEILSFMRDRAVDGLLMVINRDDDPETLRRLSRIAVPVVLWERDGGGRFDTVLTEHRAGVRAATDHLLALGHQDIVLVAGDPRTRVGREQVAGSQDAFAAAEVTPVVGRVFRVGAFGSEAFEALMRSATPPTGVIANVNEIATIVRVANGLGLSLPDDLSVVSIGDADILDVVSPAVTAVRGDGSRVGRSAADRLLRRLEGDDTEPAPVISISVPMTLVPRRSTGPRPG